MKDRIFLLLGAVLVAISAWAFWHYSGADGFSLFSLIALIVAVADNVRLRRKLRRQD